MLAVLIGDVSLFIGLLIVLLPLFLTEMSRPRDSLWGALIMIVGLILIFSKERFDGSPMLAVLLVSLIVCRLLAEIFQNRWQQLGEDEKTAIYSFQKWIEAFKQFFYAFQKLGIMVFEVINLFKRKPVTTKKWVRPENSGKIGSKESSDELSSQDKINSTSLGLNQRAQSTSKNTPPNAS